MVAPPSLNREDKLLLEEHWDAYRAANHRSRSDQKYVTFDVLLRTRKAITKKDLTVRVKRVVPFIGYATVSRVVNELVAAGVAERVGTGFPRAYAPSRATLRRLRAKTRRQ
jgi:Fe2+ or Zn2+ uptake regulation protein